ncbi:IS200/IS605 family element transposase accessory protein TnpB [Moraxella osloensis]|jgi:putative transposase|uniref:Transposase n=2 Tax=Pseudomonadota TaxID=1224 RepID=A0AA91FNC8_FAUOS|nr:MULTISPECIES: RNA-guided endonuclease TnpB family protein [Pseudomonadota]NOX78781.1 IS200/IS605 family element transposase accessory protein TnpB [Gammaproteobacteria bacterium]ONG37331.1 transposase [Enhydrobacter sp. H5]HCC65394.1 transposase [Moraxella sp.]ATQ85362.1 transposase [Moraxella osloensis]KND19554.1 transposase [Enhydrobacter aerosaccus]
MIKGHTIELTPNNKQATYFAKACGVARLAYNWALAEWQNQYQADKVYRDNCQKNGIAIDRTKLNNPSQFKLRKQLNFIKKTKFPFMFDVTKCSPQEAIIQLGKAFDNFFKGRAKYPQFRKKGINDKFSLTNDQFKIIGKNIKIPNLGWVKLTENLRFNGKIMNATIFKKGMKWFVSIGVEINETPKPLPRTDKAIGIDLGITDLAVLSNGTKVQAPKPLKSKLKQLRRLSKQLSRKQKGSKNREKAKTKLSRLHYKISCIRKDFIHKLTTKLVKMYDVICIENLNVKGMVKNRKLSRAISDLSFYEFKRQLIYKANQSRKTIKEVDRFYPSSKTCSHCGFVMAKIDLTLAIRNWQCPSCDTQHDRDINASLNILNQADRVLTLS